MLSQDHPAVLAWKQFYGKMHAWELEMVEFSKRDWDEMAEDEWDRFMDHQKEKLIDIFERCCVERANAARLAEALSYPSHAPEYDLEKEAVINTRQVNDDEVHIETRQSHAFKRGFRYTMRRCDNEWRVRATRESRPSANDGWEKESV